MCGPLSLPPLPILPIVLLLSILPLAVSAPTPAPAAAYELAINCGGAAYTSAAEGRTFIADQPYDPNGAGYVGGRAKSVLDQGYRMGGTPDSDLYFTYRREAPAYRFDVPPGDYLVRLYLGEIEVHAPGLHRLTVTIEGQPVVADLDLVALVEREYALVVAQATPVTDGTLDIELASPGFTQLNAVAVESLAPDTQPPPAPSPLTGFGSYRRNLLDWPASAAPDLAGYRVYRAPAAGGPYAPLGPDPVRTSRYLDADVTAGVAAFYRVSALDVFGNESALSNELALLPFDPSSAALPVVALTIAPPLLLQMQLDPLVDLYVDGTFSRAGETREVDIRYRGNNTRLRAKKPYKVRFPHDALWNGRRKLNYHSMFYDLTLLREGLGFRLFAGFGLLAPLNEIVHLELNDSFAGVYEQLEQVDEQFLARNGLDPASTIYKCFDSLRLLPELADYQAAYTQETHEGSSYQELIDLIELINLTPDADFPRELSRVLDIDEYLRYYAVIIAEANVDFTRSNFYLLHDSARERWRVIPWDNDFTFGYTTTPASALDLGSFENPGWQASQLIGRLMETPQFRYAHAQNLLRLAAGPFAADSVAAYLQPTYAAIEHDALRDWFKWYWEDNGPFQQGPATLAAFCDQRRAYIESAAYTLMPAVPGLLMVNELMPLNQSTIADEAGDYDPWVEIWNTAYTEIGLGGMFLSDDPLVPQRWALPDVRLPVRGHLVLWADGEPGEGPLHAPFALDAASGGLVLLFDAAGNGNGLLDAAAYGPGVADVAEGRVPDGGAPATLHVPTPGAANVGGFDPPPVVSTVAHAPQYPAHLEPFTITARIEDESGVAEARAYVDAGGGFSPLPMLDDGAHGDGAAGDGVFGGSAPGAVFQAPVRYYVWAQDDSLVAVTEPAEAPAVTHTAAIIGGAPPLFVNEFMADNETSVPDESGEYDDWMEIYNDGTYAVNLSGMSLADDFGEAGRWELPDHLLHPGTHVLIWLDDDGEQGPYHANFKLRAGGEQIAIFDVVQKGRPLLDGYAFGQQVDDISMGRLPDGGSQWVFFEVPTPGYTNTPSGVGEGGVNGNGGTGDAAAGGLPLRLALERPAPNPFNPRATLRFTLPARGPVRLAVYDLQGRLLHRLADGVLDAGEHRRVWDGRTAGGGAAASGVYWVRLETAAGTRVQRAVLLR